MQIPADSTEFDVSSVEQVEPFVRKFGLAIWRGLIPRETTDRIISYAADNYSDSKAYISVTNGVMSDVVLPDELKRTQLSPTITEVFNSVLKDELVFNDLDNTLFWTRPNFTPYGWHQDAPAMPTGKGAPQYCIIAWIPLTECSITAPGLTFALENPGKWILSPHWLGDRKIYEDNAERIIKEAGFRTIDLILKPGDVLFFDTYSMHRTTVSPHLTATRLALRLSAYGKSSAVDVDTFNLLREIVPVDNKSVLAPSRM